MIIIPRWRYKRINENITENINVLDEDRNKCKEAKKCERN